MTKKELLEKIKDFPDEAVIEYYNKKRNRYTILNSVSYTPADLLYNMPPVIALT